MVPHTFHSPSRVAFYALFVASGFAGLIYESVWTHYLKLYLGHAAYAQSLVLIVDWDRRDLLWAWGQGELVRQHEATWLPDGQVLLFDNGDETRRWSRVLAVDPAVSSSAAADASALVVLERVDNAAARQLLKELAQGDESSLVTQEAAAALARRMLAADRTAAAPAATSIRRTARTWTEPEE